MEVIWDAIARRDWERADDHALQQGWAYGAACTALGSRVLRAEIRDGGRPLARAQLVHRRFFGCLHAAVCTRGPVWLGTPGPDEKVEAVRALVRTLPLGRLSGLFVTPDGADDAAVAAAGLARVMTPSTTATLDLTRGRDGLRAAMHQKWRNRLKAAERAGLRPGRADRQPELYHWLLAREVAQSRARRYAALPPALVPAWHAAGGGVRVFTAARGGETVAAMLFLLHGRRATYHIGWAGPEGKRLSAHNLILWRAMARLGEAGIAELDLGGLNTEDMPGIARFKLGSGAAAKALCGTWFGRRGLAGLC